MSQLIVPQWPAVSGIKAYSTTRQGGISCAPYASLNLGQHVGDVVQHVTENRQHLEQLAQLPAAPCWLAQVHSTKVLTLAPGIQTDDVQADAAYTCHAGVVCTVMTADCLPVLLSNIQGTEVAAAHAGWRGLCYGILEQTVACFHSAPSEIIAWLGPAIGPTAFEVGGEVREQFIQFDAAAVQAFIPHGNKYLANIYLLAKQRLQALGIHQIYGGKHCTFTEQDRFFSYRRDGVTGRMASLIWIDDN